MPYAQPADPIAAKERETTRDISSPVLSRLSSLSSPVSVPMPAANQRSHQALLGSHMLLPTRARSPLRDTGQLAREGARIRSRGLGGRGLSGWGLGGRCLSLCLSGSSLLAA